MTNALGQIIEVQYGVRYSHGTTVPVGHTIDAAVAYALTAHRSVPAIVTRRVIYEPWLRVGSESVGLAAQRIAGYEKRLCEVCNIRESVVDWEKMRVCRECYVEVDHG